MEGREERAKRKEEASAKNCRVSTIPKKESVKQTNKQEEGRKKKAATICLCLDVCVFVCCESYARPRHGLESYTSPFF